MATTYYLTKTAASTVTTANTLTTSAPSAEDNSASTPIFCFSSSTGWGVIYSQFTSNSFANAGTEPSFGDPDGFILDDTSLEGTTWASGTQFSVSAKFEPAAGGFKMDFHFRIGKRSSGGTYTEICNVDTGDTQMFTGTPVTVTGTGTSSGSVTFNTGDKLYVQLDGMVDNAAGGSNVNERLFVFTNGGSAESFTVTPPAATTKTQTAIARIQITGTDTQNAVARIQNTVTKSQNALARIQNTATAAQSALARIQNTVTNTISAVARIQISGNKAQPATARLQGTPTKTQTAISRISKSFTKLQTAIARIAKLESATQPATARVENSVSAIQSATAHIVVAGNVTKTQTATARISKTLTLDQQSVSRIQASRTLTQPAVSRLEASRSLTQPAVARIRNLSSGVVVGHFDKRSSSPGFDPNKGQPGA